MSCRSTKGGTAALRYVRRVTGLSDKQATSLFHALKREGANIPAPDEAALDEWRIQLREQLDSVDTTESQKARSQRDLLASSSESYDGPTFYALSMIEARAKQERVIAKMRSSAAHLEPAGSQSSSYELDENGKPVHVWYASYGSNLNPERFNAYLTGAEYEGMAVSAGGARDKTLPEDSVGVLMPGRLVFASRSGRWGGGAIAFLDAEDEYSQSAGQAYKISWQQFEDVLAQESGGAAGSASVDWSELAQNSEHETSGLYGKILHIGDLKGAPVVTFTSDYAADELAEDFAEKPQYSYKRLNRPHGNYVRTIAIGLEQAFGLDKNEQSDYLRGALGGHYYKEDEMRSTVSSPFEKIVRDKPTRPAISSRRGLNSNWNNDWSKKRDYIPWWEDENDPVNKRAKARYRDDEVPDWWYEFEDDQDDKELQNWLDDMWDDRDPRYEQPMAFQPYPRKSYRNKVCAICNSTQHDMHDCPYFEGRE